jgi:hypothetical protein
MSSNRLHRVVGAVFALMLGGCVAGAPTEAELSLPEVDAVEIEGRTAELEGFFEIETGACWQISESSDYLGAVRKSQSGNYRCSDGYSLTILGDSDGNYYLSCCGSGTY